MSGVATYIDTSWYVSTEGKEILSSLLTRNKTKRKTFGLLEKPSLPPQTAPDEYKYKIFVVGRGGVGKTSTIAKLAGHTIPHSYNETPGIQTTAVHWPAKMTDINKVVMFNLEFWDAGENSLKKFDNILPACKDSMDAALFLFSFTDKSGFLDLPQQISRICDAETDACKLIIGTKYDLHSKTEVTVKDLGEFEQQWRLPVMRICNRTEGSQSGESMLNEVAPILTAICEQVWHRDQILSGKVAASDLSSEPKITFC